MKNISYGFYFIIIFSFLSCQSNHQPIQPGTTIQANLSIRNQENEPITTIVLYSVPKNYKSDTPSPLLVALHGYGSNAAAFHDLWKPVTDSLGFVLLTPQGEESVLNNLGWGWGENAENFVFSSIDLIQKEVFIHPKGIYLTGFSQGGSRTYELGFRYPNIFKGIAPLGAGFKNRFLPQNLENIKCQHIYIGHGELENNLETAKDAFELLSQSVANIQATHSPTRQKRNSSISLIS